MSWSEAGVEERGLVESSPCSLTALGCVVTDLLSGYHRFLVNVNVRISLLNC